MAYYERHRVLFWKFAMTPLTMHEDGESSYGRAHATANYTVQDQHRDMGISIFAHASP